ncbi:MAG: nuclear transport factor 2 family protein [Phycisphaeraceae bacterium]
MSTTTTQSAAETQVRELVDSYVDAIRASDVERITSYYAPDILAFDAIAQLQFKGVEAYKKHWQACIAMCASEGMIFELHKPSFAVSGDVAFGHWLCRCGPATEDSGEDKTGYMRGTLGFRKTGGRWLIVHEHWSAPFDMDSGKALFDLKP